MRTTVDHSPICAASLRDKISLTTCKDEKKRMIIKALSGDKILPVHAILPSGQRGSCSGIFHELERCKVLQKVQQGLVEHYALAA